MYVGDGTERRGATVHRCSWSNDWLAPTDPAIEDWIYTEVNPVLDALGGSPLFMAKSLDTDARAARGFAASDSNDRTGRSSTQLRCRPR